MLGITFSDLEYILLLPPKIQAYTEISNVNVLKPYQLWEY